MSKVDSPIRAATLLIASLAGLADARAFETQTPELEVSSTRIQTRLMDSGSRISVLDAHAIRSRGASTVADLLRDEAGLTLVSQGGNGQLTQVYFRGLPAGQTIVRVDGIKVNDPANPDRLFDFANLGAASIERIEIVHGAPAEIRIYTRKAQASAAVSVGSYGTVRSGAFQRGEGSGIRYSFGLEQLRSEGFSAATGTGKGAEADARMATALTAAASRAWGTLGETSASLRLGLARNELDAFDGVRTLDDPFHVAWERSLQASLVQNLQAGESWGLRLATGAALSRRLNENPPPSTGAVRSQRYFGDRLQAELSAIRTLEPGGTFSISSEIEREEADFDDGVGPVRSGLDQQIRSLGAALDGLPLWKDSSTGVAARWTGAMGRGSAVTAGLSHRMQLSRSLLARGSVASGVRFPSLYQLHADLGGGFGGNPSLLPERSLSLDAGVEWIGRSLTASLGVFANQIREQIQFTPTGYENLARTRTEGAEARIGLRTGRSNMRGQVTWLAIARDEITGDRLPQRPRLQLSVNESYGLTSRLDLVGNLRFHGARSAGTAPELISSYTLLDAGVRWQVSPRLALRGGIENLADRVYEEVPGYGTARRSVSAGIEGRLD